MSDQTLEWIKVKQAEGLEAALLEALAYDGPALIEVVTDEELI